MKNKGISISIGIGEFIGMLIAFGIIILIIRIILGDVIKLKLEKEEYIESGKAANLANAILNFGEINYFDEINQPKKGIVSKYELIKINNKNKPMDCCDYLDYDYSIRIKTEDEVYNIGYSLDDLKELTNLGKQCKSIYDIKTLKSYKFPLVLQDEDKKQDASMYITLAKTPLTFISTEVSLSCIKDSYENIINVYGFNEENLKITNLGNGDYNICLKNFKGIEMCKRIKCEKNIQIKKISENCINNDNNCAKDCGYVLDNDCRINTCSLAKIKSKNNEVIICFAGKEKELEYC